MAHSCPECDATCYCGGDLDDVLLEAGQAGCTHCDDWEDDDLDVYDYEDDDDE